MKKVSKAAPALVIAALLLLWEVVVQAAEIPLYVLPAPSDMMRTFCRGISGVVEACGCDSDGGA